MEYDLETCAWTRTTPTRATIGVRSLTWLSVAEVDLCRVSRTQKCVTLSTEAEYVAMADEVKEALYVRGVMVFVCPVRGHRVSECLNTTKRR